LTHKIRSPGASELEVLILLTGLPGRKSSITQKKEDIDKEKFKKKLDVSQSIKGFLFIYNEFYPDSVRKM
jgi:hypothetical protein